jgi:HD-GYP domain-containing protein (c-di-GMP phosphodiesterase class II)
MKVILVISDSELLSQLYITNLEVYLNSKVKLVNDCDAALSFLESGETVDLIITLANIQDKNILDSLRGQLQKKEEVIPIIAIGELVETSPEVYEVKSYYSVQNIVRTAAKILGVTAKSMFETVVPKFFPIDLHFLFNLQKTPVNLYLELKKNNAESEYTIFSNSGSLVADAVKGLLKDGVEFVFVNAQDRLTLVNAVSLSICDELNNSEVKSVEDKMNLIETSMEFVAKTYVSAEVSAEIVSLANACTQKMSEVLLEVPSLKYLLKTLLNNKNGFIYTHSMLGAYVASHIVKNVPWGGESHLEKINFVLFFHDIALTPIFEKHPEFTKEEDLLYSEEITEEEKEIVLNHAKLSAELVSGLKKCPIGSDLLIKQHHGMGNGVGFATEFRDDISPLSKIIIISEAFIECMMENKVESEKQCKLNEIISNLNEQFPKHTYKKIIETLSTIKI